MLYGLWILAQQRQEKQETARQSQRDDRGVEEEEEEEGARKLHLVETGPYVHSQNELEGVKWCQGQMSH